jgi:PDZ domain-containing protein
MSVPERVSDSPQRDERPRSLFSYAVAALVVVVLVGLILELIPANEYMLLPGQALPVAPMISIGGRPAPHAPGHLYMTDVSLYKVDHLLQELYGKLNSDADLQPAQSFTGNLSQTQYYQLNTELMDDSIYKAEAAALSVTRGYKLHFSPEGPQIIFVKPGTPAQSRLRSGDILQLVNGRRVHRAGDVAPIVRSMHPGQVAALQILRKGRIIRLHVRTVRSPNGKTALIGIYLQDRIVFPVRVQIHAGDIGGPSAGLMFSLGIVQRLQKQDLTHGCKVAGTGTIDFDGAVGAIGGAKQKIIAAQRTGARYFLVPDVPDNVRPAMANRGDITVLPVKTLREALARLSRIKPCR